jgi:hypothetical protein
MYVICSTWHSPSTIVVVVAVVVVVVVAVLLLDAVAQVRRLIAQ